MTSAPRTHTRGPWHRNVPPASHYSTIWAGRNTHVARVVPGAQMSPEEIEANANLIAAAPDLLEALAAIVQADDFWKRQEAIGNARRVMARALGGA